MGIKVKEVQSKKDFKDFIKLPWKIYKNDSNWVPPLISQMKDKFNPKKYPYFNHAKVKLFLAYNSKDVIGRIAAHIDEKYNDFYDESAGFFGFFECFPNYKIAEVLFRTAEKWLRENKINLIRGPMNYSTNDECGLLIKGFHKPPVIMMSYNPQYYQSFVEKYGFVKAKDILAYYLKIESMPELFERLIERIKNKQNFNIRNLNHKRYKQDVKKIFKVYNKAWQYNWGFVPMTEKEFLYLAKEMKPILDFDFAYIVEIDGKPVGFSLTLPDINQALKNINGRLFPFGWLKLFLSLKKINQVRVITLGVIDEYQNMGIDLALYYKTIKTGLKKNIAKGELSWVLEDNYKMKNPIKKMGGKVYKVYRIFKKNIS